MAYFRSVFVGTPSRHSPFFFLLFFFFQFDNNTENISKGSELCEWEVDGSGSALVFVVSVCRVLLPEMRERWYSCNEDIGCGSSVHVFAVCCLAV